MRQSKAMRDSETEQRRETEHDSVNGERQSETEESRERQSETEQSRDRQ